MEKLAKGYLLVLRQFELSEKVRAYNPNADIELIDRAYVYAMQAHGSQQRESGDPYFHHPVEVAGILADMRLDTATIVTALLHDTVEDTRTTINDIIQIFGPEIGKLVDGVTKLRKMELQSENTQQAENFRKLIIASSKDLRVLLVKLADRLHNMRTLYFIKSEEKRLRIARETLDIYAPLSERIGIQSFKDELDDLAFAQLYPDAYENIKSRLDALQEPLEQTLIQRIIDELTEKLKEQGKENIRIFGRIKRPYSIWRKISRQNISVDQLADLMAFRIIVGSLRECYEILGILHSAYSVLSGRFKDYISTPKPNRYQSLHTAIIGPENRRIEVQIRTHEMDEVAEYGVAAHWIYKENSTASESKHHQGDEYRWIRSLLDILDKASDPQEFLEHTKLEMFQEQVFVFTPTGELISLPRGATPIDFAYAIHSDIGNRCIGAKINGRLVPLRSYLKNGDQVEIVTSQSQIPSITWERFVVTGKARANIRRFLRVKLRDQYITLGKSLLHRAFQSESLAYQESILKKALKHYHCKDLNDLFAAVGEGQHEGHDVVHYCLSQLPENEKAHYQKKSPQDVKDLVTSSAPSQGKSISIQGLIPGMAVHYAHCCHPLPGEAIIGIVVTGRGVTIHHKECKNLESFNHNPHRLIDVSWQKKSSDDLYSSRLMMTIDNSALSLGSVSQIISQEKANICGMKILNRMETFWDVQLDIEVHDTEHLQRIMASLRTCSKVHSVSRQMSVSR